MSVRISQQTMIMVSQEAEKIINAEKNQLEHAGLVRAILGRMREQSVQTLMTAEQQADFAATGFFRSHARLRRRLQKRGDLFRPQLLVPVAPKTLSRLGPGGILTLTGWQSEVNSKVKGAARIIEEAATVSGFCNKVIEKLVPRPTYTVSDAMIEFFDYKWRPDDDQPFQVADDFVFLDDELGEAAEDATS